MTTSNKLNFIGNLTKKRPAFGILFNGVFLSVALGHFSVDMLNGTRATVLTFLSTSLGFNNAVLGAISTGYVWASAATQPIFGWLTDRIGTRWIASIGILWMFCLYGLAMTLTGPLALAALILGSLGSAAFHPAGTTEATLVGREMYAGREATSASFFFFAGQFGLFLGPVLSGPLLDHFGVLGLLAMASILVPIGLNAGWQLRDRHLAHAERKASEAKQPKVAASRNYIILLATIGALQAWAQQNMITFVPKYVSDLGQTAAIYGLISGLFMGGSAFGNVLGGNLADKFGKRRIIMIALALASVPLFLVSRVGWSPWLYVLVPLAGALTGSVHSIVVVLAQRALPMGMATASGLTLGFIFSAGAAGTLICGPLADTWGWPLVFQLTAVLTLFAASLTLLMKEKV